MIPACAVCRPRVPNVRLLWLLLVGAVVAFPISALEFTVADPEAFATALQGAAAGDCIRMASGEWRNAGLIFQGEGRPEAPIRVEAAEPGRTVLSGHSYLWIQGRHLVVSGLVFREGFLHGGRPEQSYVVRFCEDSAYCRLTDCEIVDYNPPDKETKYFWVGIEGTHHRVDHCRFSGQRHRGVSVAVFLDGRPVYHRIDHNVIADRPPGGSNGFEAMSIGRIVPDLRTKARATVDHNLFMRCNGEGEIITNKSSENVIADNIFMASRGALVFRQGNGSHAQGNLFFGDGVKGTRGIVLHGKRHLVANNYFEGLTGPSVSFGNGDRLVTDENRESPAYRVTKDCVVAFNTSAGGLVSPLEFGTYGAARDEEGRLLYPDPPADNAICCNIFSVRSGGPIVRTVVPPRNTTWRDNIAHGAVMGVSVEPDGMRVVDPLLCRAADGLLRPGPGSPAVDAASNGAFPVEKDMDGQIRATPFDIGADEQGLPARDRIAWASNRIGPSWRAVDWFTWPPFRPRDKLDR